MPKISVIMSVYNGGDYLDAAIESVLTQSYKNFELILIDDASTDNTYKTLKDYASSDNRIILIQNERNIGLTRSLNKGLYIARGLYVARQDHDDVSLPLRFERQAQFLDANPSTVLVSCNFDVIDENGDFVLRKILSCESILIEWNLIFSNYLEGHSQVMFRKKPVMSLGGYSESFVYAQDYDLWQKLSRLGKVAILPEVLLKYRIHNKRLTNLAGDKQFKNVQIVSADKIRELTGKCPDRREVKNLWIFWCLVYRFDFFPAEPSALLAIHFCLKSIFSAFIIDYGNKYPTEIRNDTRLVRQAIAKRYYRWCLLELTKRRDLICAIFMFAGVIYWLRFNLITIGFHRLRQIINRKIANFISVKIMGRYFF